MPSYSFFFLKVNLIMKFTLGKISEKKLDDLLSLSFKIKVVLIIFTSSRKISLKNDQEVKILLINIEMKNDLNNNQKYFYNQNSNVKQCC